MYHYVTDKEFLHRMRNLCGGMMQELCHTLCEDYDIGANFYLVGSGARNLIMQNESEPVDLDYNLEIIRCDHISNCRHIKECVRKAFNQVLGRHGWRDCQDSKSSLTTETRYFTHGNDTGFSMDVCIVRIKTDNGYDRLIHKKTGLMDWDEYIWNPAPHSERLRNKATFIKKRGMWEAVRDQYADIKNRYLVRNDYDHPSFICYAEAVNNVYNERNYW